MPKNLLNIVKELFFKAFFCKAKFSIFFNILRPHFQNSFVPFFCAKLKDGTQKKTIENQTPV